MIQIYKPSNTNYSENGDILPSSTEGFGSCCFKWRIAGRNRTPY